MTLEEAIVRQYNDGATCASIAQQRGMSPATVSLILKKKGVEIRIGRPVGSYRPPLRPILKEKLELLAKILGKPVNRDVLQTIVRYAIRHIDGRTFRKLDYQYNYNGAFSQFRREHLESSYYVTGRLWRCVYHCVTSNRMQCADYGVAREDVKLCMSVLEPEDIQRIKEWVAKTGDYVYLPNEDGVRAVVQECEKTIDTIVNSKLRFIYQYDPAFEKADLVSYLMVIAYRVAIKYDWEMLDGKFDHQKCVNYTKRSLWNAAGLLLKENTGDDYRRLERVDNEQRLYQVTTISLDTSEDDDWISIERKLGADADTSFEVQDLVLNVADPKLYNFLRLEFEEVPEFTAFVKQETGKDENELYAKNYARWRELAQSFAGLSTRDDRIWCKRQILIELGMWNRAKMKRKFA
jgi:hypothetical protein